VPPSIQPEAEQLTPIFSRIRWDAAWLLDRRAFRMDEAAKMMPSGVPAAVRVPRLRALPSSAVLPMLRVQPVARCSHRGGELQPRTLTSDTPGRLPRVVDAPAAGAA
jgi:hypothetical protein